MAGTDLCFRFYWLTAIWLVRQGFGPFLTIDWKEFEHRDRLTDLWHGADLPSLTLEFVDNLVQVPTFILHGEDDDNVPVTEARRMEKALRAAGADPIVHYQPGVRHWWNGDEAKGVDCVDWPGVFALFRECRKSAGADEVRFLSADPAVDADHHWLHVHQPLAKDGVNLFAARLATSFVAVEQG